MASGSRRAIHSSACRSARARTPWFRRTWRLDASVMRRPLLPGYAKNTWQEAQRPRLTVECRGAGRALENEACEHDADAETGDEDGCERPAGGKEHAVDDQGCRDHDVDEQRDRPGTPAFGGERPIVHPLDEQQMKAQDTAHGGGDANDAENSERRGPQSLLDEPREYGGEEVKADDDCLMRTPPSQGVAVDDRLIGGERGCDAGCRREPFGRRLPEAALDHGRNRTRHRRTETFDGHDFTLKDSSGDGEGGGGFEWVHPARQLVDDH